MSDSPALSTRPALAAAQLLRQPWRRQALALRAAGCLLVAWWQVRHWPFARLAGHLGCLGGQGHVDVEPDAVALAQQVRWALAAWARHWPRTPTCLMLAVAAQRLLARQGVGSTMYFGVSTEPGLASPTPGLAAHAWLRVGPVVVTGAREAASFKPLASYYLAPGSAAGQP